MVERHAMLVIARAAYDLVEIPGQEPLTVPMGAGEEAASPGRRSSPTGKHARKSNSAKTGSMTAARGST